jgi:peptide-methionine (S)-S-oxide reductase
MPDAQKQKKGRKMWIVILAVVLFIIAGGFVCYLMFGQQMIRNHLRGLPGNAVQYEPVNIEADSESPLRGKTVIFLGSSVTRGYGASDTSFVELLAQKDGVIPVKEAVGGTTLITRNKESYIPRMENLDPAIRADAFVCQLSTNDASQGIPLEKTEQAIRAILDYTDHTYHCPVVFYTGTYYESQAYSAMIRCLYDLQAEYGFFILDLFNDPEMRAVSAEDYARYMSDPIHPNLLGYRQWWTPKFVDFCRRLTPAKTAYFAGGCFWCITPTFKEMEGVADVISGYSGGQEKNPTYLDVKYQRTGHREAIRVDYFPEQVSFPQLFQIFLDGVDPFDPDGQFIDRGHSYTLAVYYLEEAEKEIACSKIRALEGTSGKPVYISVEPFKSFYTAEEEHQDYYRKHPVEFQQELVESGRIKLI